MTKECFDFFLSFLFLSIISFTNTPLRMDMIILPLKIFRTTFSLCSAIIISGVVSDVFLLEYTASTFGSSLSNVIFEIADNDLDNEANTA